MANCPYNIPYKAYRSIEPCTNVYLKQKWDRSGYEHFVRRLKDIKCVVDDSPPFAYRHNSQLRNKENKLKEENKKDVICLNQYEYNLKKAVQEQYKKDQINKMNENLLEKLKYMARESDYGRNKLLKASKEHDRLLKSLSRYPPPQSPSKKKNTQNKKKKRTTKNKTTSTTTEKIKVSKKPSSSSLSSFKDEEQDTVKTTKKILKPKDLNVYLTKSTEKQSFSKSNSNSNTSLKKSSKNIPKPSKKKSNYNKTNNHSRTSSCDSNSSLINIENQNSDPKEEKENLYTEYKLIKSKIDHLNDKPVKVSIDIYSGNSDNDLSASMESVKKKVLAETELIQNRDSQKIFDLPDN